MPEYFGTDGVRGVANEELTPEFCLQLGRAAGEFLKQYGDTVLIGRDSRVSGTMLEGALSAGLTSVGLKVKLLGIVPTPVVAFLSNELDVAGGAMISASHNPVPDNGVKFFDKQGLKLGEAQEEEIESNLSTSLARPSGTEIASVTSEAREVVDRYQNKLVDKYNLDLRGYKVVLDCAYGATYKIAPELYSALGAQVISINDAPEGDKINVDCGSTNPEVLSERVVSENADLGLAFDGDGDRVIAVDEQGNEVNGDKIMAILAKYTQEKGELSNDTIVATKMSNLGLDLAMEDLGIEVKRTKVGDRYVLKEMMDNNYVLGGEQSGHIINFHDNTTGDGIISGIKLLEVINAKGESLNYLASKMRELPQLLVNVKVTKRKEASQDPEILEAKQKAEQELGNKGRIFLRPSGTEPVIRVMIEGENQETLHELANRLTQVIKDKYADE